MLSIICDSCKKPVSGASRGRNYFSLLSKDLCAGCNEKLYSVIAHEMNKKQNYSYSTYQHLIKAKLNDLCR